MTSAIAAVRGAPAGARRFGVRGTAAVLDQGLFAGATFVANVLLARWLEPAAYGAFALAFLAFLLLGALHSSLLTEPLLVFGAGEHHDRFDLYVGRVLVGHAAMSAALVAALAPAALAFELLGMRSVSAILAGLAVGTPCLLLLWLARRVFYVTLRPHVAAVGDGVYLATTCAGLYALLRAGLLSPGAAFAVLGAAALPASAFLLVLARPRLRGGGPELQGLARAHWRYGSWSLVAQTFFWSSGQILPVLVSLALGLRAVAVLAAANLLFRPLGLLMQSVNGLLLPHAASLARGGAGAQELARRLNPHLIASTIGVAVYGVALTIAAQPLMQHLYNGRYEGDRLVVFLLAIAYAASMFVAVQSVSLKASGNIRVVPWLWARSAVLTLVLAVPAMLVAGLEGGLVVLAASYAVAAWSARRITRKVAR